jgi:DNA polymerase III epsilon subunit-like protein
MSKYLALDCETGGLEGTSLLSLYCGVYDESFTLLDELELFLRPKDHIYHVTAEGLGINKIDLVEHEKKAIPYAEGGTLLYDFIEKHSVAHNYYIPAGVDIREIANLRLESWSGSPMLKIAALGNGTTIEKLEPLGHNVDGDIRLVKENLISEGSWLKYVSYRVQDTGVVGNFLKKQGKIPKEISGSLSSYAEHFKVDNTKAHDAKADVIMCINVYKEMLKL